MGIIELLIIIILLGAVFGGPWWGHSRNWGYGPFGALIAILIILVFLRLLHLI